MKRLCLYHDQMLSIMADGEQIIYRFADQPDLATLNSRRQTMVQVLTSYQMFVHRELFEPLLANGSASQISQVKLIKAECVALVEAFRAFFREWMGDAVVRQWDIYKQAARGMMDRIKRHIAEVRQITMLEPASRSGA